MSAQLAVAGENLAALLAAENAALAAGDMAGAGRMLAAKTQALVDWKAALAGDGPAEAGEHGVALTRRIAGLATENRRLLDRALLVQGRLLEMIARAAPAEHGVSYRSAGRPVPMSRPTPLALLARA